MINKYVIIHGNKAQAKKYFFDGLFMIWNENNLKNAFSNGHGTIKDLERFTRDNAGNTTAINAETLLYIDTGKPANITRAEIENTFYKYHINTY